MAIMRPGPLAGQLSGRVGGIVFSRNRGGDYVRNGPSPINPQTGYQGGVRNALSLASADWDSRTAEQRLAWEGWSRNHPVQNRLGESIRLQGNAAYVGLNARMALLGWVMSVNPPSVNAPDPLLSVTLTLDKGAGAFEIAYTATPLAPTVCLWVLGCNMISPARMFVKNSLRHFYLSANNAASPANIESAFNTRFGVPAVGDHVVFLVGTIDAANGQVSAMLRAEGNVVST
jgi:hypothetical protein